LPLSSGPGRAADDMNICARKGDIRSDYANLRVGIDANKRTKCEDVIGLDHSQLFLQRAVAGLQTLELGLQLRVAIL
jgi:hypothetical protein